MTVWTWAITYGDEPEIVFLGRPLYAVVIEELAVALMSRCRTHRTYSALNRVVQWAGRREVEVAVIPADPELLADLDPDGFWTLAALAERDDDL